MQPLRSHEIFSLQNHLTDASGPAAIEQHAGTPSSVIAKAHDAVKWQADPKRNLLLAEEPSPSQLPLVQPQPSGLHNLSGCGINNHTMSPLCSMLKDFTPILSLNLSNNQIGESGMKVLARALGYPCLAQLQRLDIRHNRHDGIKPLTSALAELGHCCWDGQPYKSKIYGIGWVCKRCGLPKASHSTTRKLGYLEKFSTSMKLTTHQDVAALGMAISKGAFPSLEHVNLDDFGYMLDSGGHRRRETCNGVPEARGCREASARLDLDAFP